MGAGQPVPGDPVVITELEHHANIVPWHQLTDEIGIELRWIPVGADGHLDHTDLGPADRRGQGGVVRSHVQRARHDQPGRAAGAGGHDAGAIAVVDASQYVPHLPTDVGAWGADFAAFTGHKMLGPTGIGVLGAPRPSSTPPRPS